MPVLLALFTKPANNVTRLTAGKAVRTFSPQDGKCPERGSCHDHFRFHRGKLMRHFLTAVTPTTDAENIKKAVVKT
jgi:hypothetical protein